MSNDKSSEQEVKEQIRRAIKQAELEIKRNKEREREKGGYVECKRER